MSDVIVLLIAGGALAFALYQVWAAWLLEKRISALEDYYRNRRRAKSEQDNP